jgi:hypothetical protein
MEGKNKMTLINVLFWGTLAVVGWVKYLASADDTIRLKHEINKLKQEKEWLRQKALSAYKEVRHD